MSDREQDGRRTRGGSGNWKANVSRNVARGEFASLSSRGLILELKARWVPPRLHADSRVHAST